MVKRFFGWVGRNGTTIIATCSFFVSLLSLGLAYLVATSDINYKEASIRPVVAMGASVDDFSFYLENFGAGAAVVKRVVFGVGEKCYASDKTELKKFESMQEEFSKDVTQKLYLGALPPTPWKKKGGAKPGVSWEKVFVDLVIRAGGKYVIARLDQPSLDELRAIDPDALYEAKGRFAETASRIPLAVRYCSVTGWTCEIITSENEQCQ